MILSRRARSCARTGLANAATSPNKATASFPQILQPLLNYITEAVRCQQQSRALHSETPALISSCGQQKPRPAVERGGIVERLSPAYGAVSLVTKSLSVSVSVTPMRVSSNRSALVVYCLVWPIMVAAWKPLCATYHLPLSGYWP